MGELLKLSSIFLLSLFPPIRDFSNFSSWISLFSPLDSKVFFWDHSSFSCSSTKGTWSFVAISLVDPLGLLPFLLGFLYGSHSGTYFFTTFYWIICTLFKALSSCFCFCPFFMAFSSSFTRVFHKTMGPSYSCKAHGLILWAGLAF